ncbi:MAG: acetyltransferase [Planctomycetales bacterium]|nr:acetyltransferase [Planctomycetales bacterium]
MSDKLNLVIVGAGGFGRELYEMLWAAFSPAKHDFKGFLAQSDQSLNDAGLDVPFLGDPLEYNPEPDDRFLMAIGYMDARRTLYESLTSRGGTFASFVHPKALVASTAEIGPGAVIYPFAVVSNASVLDDCTHLNYYASAGHDCKIGKYCLLAPYATLNGFVTLEDGVYISTHGVVAPGKTVGRDSKVSAGSCAMQDVTNGAIVFGVPGRQVRGMTHAD